MKQQQKAVFEWAPNAPEKLGVTENGSKETTAQGPKFILYFGPVLDALRSMGGEAKPKDVYDWLIKNGHVTESEATAVNKSGKSKFENKVGWARFYLAKAGLLDDRRRGIWALTPEGRDANIDQAQALALFKEVHSRFQENEAEDDAAPPPTSVLSDSSMILHVSSGSLAPPGERMIKPKGLFTKVFGKTVMMINSRKTFEE